jgi:hypothetical protein
MHVSGVFFLFLIISRLSWSFVISDFVWENVRFVSHAFFFLVGLWVGVCV